MRLFLSVLGAALILAAPVTASAQERPVVVAVNYPLKFIAERLLGEAADIHFPVPQGVDPSFWRPSVADITAVQSADLILLNGAGFAAWVDRVSLPRSRIVNSSADIADHFIVTKSITHSHGEGREHSHEGLASYIWLDPTLAAAQARAVARAIKAMNLAAPEDISRALTALEADLAALDDTARTALSPLQGIGLIATHPRYQYLAQRYDLTLTSLEWDAGSMPTPDQIAELSVMVEKTGAKVLIWEATPPKAAFDLTRDLGLRNVVFAPLAHGVDGMDFISVFENALSALAAGAAP